MPGNALIFWDEDSCRPPRDKDVSEFVRKVCGLAHQTTATVNIYLDVIAESKQPNGESFLRALFMSGATLIHCPADIGAVRSITLKMSNDIQSINSASSPHITTIVAISSEASFSYMISSMKLRGYDVIHIGPCNCATGTRVQGTYCWYCDIIEENPQQTTQGDLIASPRHSLREGSSTGNKRANSDIVDFEAGHKRLRHSNATSHSVHEGLYEAANSNLLDSENAVVSASSTTYYTASNVHSSVADEEVSENEDQLSYPPRAPVESRMELDHDALEEGTHQPNISIRAAANVGPVVAPVSDVEPGEVRPTNDKTTFHLDANGTGVLNLVHPSRRSQVPSSSKDIQRSSDTSSELTSTTRETRNDNESYQRRLQPLETPNGRRSAGSSLALRTTNESIQDLDFSLVSHVQQTPEILTPIRLRHAFDAASSMSGPAKNTAKLPAKPQSLADIPRPYADPNKLSHPVAFDALLEAMVQAMSESGKNYVFFGELDKLLKSRNPLVYANAGVMLLPEYLKLAERLRIVQISYPSTDGKQAVRLTDRYARYMKHPEFRHLVDVLWEDMDKGISVSVGSTVGNKLLKKDSSVYSKAGVIKLKPYLQLAEEKGIISLNADPVVHDGASSLCKCSIAGQIHVRLHEDYLNSR